MIRLVLALICIAGSLAFVTADELTDKIDDSLESEGSVKLGISLGEAAPEESVRVSELPKQSRDSFNFVSERLPATRPVVRNNIYNFYNYRTPQQDMTQPGQSNYQPGNYQSNNYQPNGYQPTYQPGGYQQNYQQPNYNQYYGRPNYQTYPNYYQQPQQQQQQQLLQPLQVNPQQQLQQQQQQPQQLLQAPDPTQPIGYMLINKYRSPFGTITKPVAFFKTR